MRGSTSCVTRVTKSGPKTVHLEARSGRGRRREKWVDALHEHLRNEFDLLRRLGVKFNITVLRHLALNLLDISENGAYSPNMMDPRSDTPLRLKVDLRWIQSFTDRYNIVSRFHKVKCGLRPEKEKLINVSDAVHLGIMCTLLKSGKISEDDVENTDETHFIINMDNGKTLVFSGSQEVKYADVVSGGEGFTMVVRLSGGT